MRPSRTGLESAAQQGYDGLPDLLGEGADRPALGAVAGVVGTILFAINQRDVVLRGDATAVVWIKTAVTYLVPVAVANAGLLSNGIEDVTSGNNSYNGVTGYNTGAGFDLVTGWGSVDMNTFATAFNSVGQATPTPTSSASPSATPTKAATPTATPGLDPVS